ncbi:MAG: hypothetical protein PHC75_08150 [Burkholderiales bacterium]|nr:hypothetical protein [Burkholderiales bacterium]
MKKKLLVGLLILLVVVFISVLYLFFQSKSTDSYTVNPVSEYEDVLKEAESHLIIPNAEQVKEPVALTTMLESGINTNGGLLLSKKMSDQATYKYKITLNKNDIGINTVSQIELVKAFLVESQQVLLFGFNQGGNQCDKEYQFLAINGDKHKLSKVFGSCLPITNIVESGGDIYVLMPQNNPYLGDNIATTYIYHDFKITEVKKSNKQVIRSIYKNLTAKQVIQMAAKDSCYQDGVMLDSSSCDGGRKYCAMFKSLQKPKKDSNYYILKDFCS